MKQTCAWILLLMVCAACRGPSAIPPHSADVAAIVEDWRTRAGTPGAVVSVRSALIGDSVVASGTLRHEGDERIRGGDHFRAASVTKTLVAAAILQLREESRLSLDEPASRFLPDRTNRLLGAMVEGVTLRHLLGHTSGIPDSARSQTLIDSLLAHPERIWTTGQVLELVATREPEFHPGTDFGYSNTNYLLLGEVIETVTGEPWWKALRERVLEPAGMTDSYFAGVEDPRGELVPGYFDTDNDGLTEEVPDRWTALATTEGAAGSLVATAADLAGFMEALAGTGLISAASLQDMTTPGPFSSRYTGYGLGVEVAQPDLETTVWGHGGHLPGYRGVMWRVPAHGVTIVVLANESQSRPDGLAELLLQAMTE